ncbi:MAG: biotin transporter BioY [Sphaerochaetaceae bacterium]|jgi:biotin transport system substrate-specific component|nr:biotin transporter BioY [Sphaerochaetaceae bacterium]
MNLRRIIITALCAALIVVGAYTAIPIGPVPVTLQTAFVLLAGILAGKTIALASIATYLVLGVVGLPVFSGGVGGFAHLAGPTGGFLISWLVAGPLAGIFADRGFRKDPAGEKTTTGQLAWIIAGTITGTVALYLLGLPYLKMILRISWEEAVAIGLLPFIAGDLIKIVSVVILGNIFAPQVRQFLAAQAEGDADESGPGA